VIFFLSVIAQCSWREVVGVFGGFVKEEELGWKVWEVVMLILINVV
jgi:hypothetical protein